MTTPPNYLMGTAPELFPDLRIKSYLYYLHEYMETFFASLPPVWQPLENLKTYDEWITFASENGLPPFEPPVTTP